VLQLPTVVMAWLLPGPWAALPPQHHQQQQQQQQQEQQLALA
jgi:hypothetical protein